MLNIEQLTSFVRYAIGLASGWAIGKGYLDESTAALIGGIVLAGLPLIWGYLSHTNAAKIAAAETVPTVTKIVVDDPKVAREAGDKVISVAVDAMRHP